VFVDPDNCTGQAGGKKKEKCAIASRAAELLGLLDFSVYHVRRVRLCVCVCVCVLFFFSAASRSVRPATENVYIESNKNYTLCPCANAACL